MNQQTSKQILRETFIIELKQIKQFSAAAASTPTDIEIKMFMLTKDKQHRKNWFISCVCTLNAWSNLFFYWFKLTTDLVIFVHLSTK